MILASLMLFVGSLAFAQKGRPILILTQNGQVVVKIVGPKGANDVRVFWGGPAVPEGGGYGYWTKNGQEIPKSRFQFGSDINDIHFSTSGRVPRFPPIPAPHGANDVEIRWEESGRITEAWWTRDGQRLEQIPLVRDVEEISLQFDSKTTNGLFVTTFDTPQGKVKVNLPDDVAAGDTISGTVETEPAGKNDAERAQNQAELNGYVIEVEGQKTKVGDKKFTCKIPTVLTPEAKTIVLQHNGHTVATNQIPIAVTPPPTPTQFTLPTGGQQGRPIQIKGPCDGVFSPQDHVKVGPTILPPVAESPRSLVVLNTSDVVGPTTIECNENGATVQSPFRNIGINLSAPKLNLQRGENTTLHVVVSGLAGITQGVPLDLVNNSTGVINMSGGEVQHQMINPTAVQRDGTYSIDRTLIGIMAGAFVVTGTVTWTETYTKEVTGGVIAGGPGPVSQPTPSATPLTPTDTSNGVVCKWVNYKTYRVDEFKRVDSKDKDLEVRHSSAQGGGVAVEFHCKAAGTFIFVVSKDSGSPDVVSVTCTQP
ncbi:MAG: hypothetical protein DMF73_16240 [Acidobacteria bacterium]|nr:MAG: hypothetical protein DMF73_16240 [Acidobacteriota bacterium]